MDLQTSTYEVVQSKQSEWFDLDNLSDYNLYLSIGKDDLKIFVADATRREVAYLEHLNFRNRLPTDDLVTCLSRVYQEHLFLQANFWRKIHVCLRSEAFTLVPNEYFQEDALSKYVNTVASTSENQYIYSFQQPSLDAQHVFLAPKELTEWFQDITYPNVHVTFSHQAGALLEGIFHNPQYRHPVDIHIQVESSSLLVLVIRGKVVELCNVFSYRTKQDFAYYTLLVMDELRLDPKTCPVHLYGNIYRKSGIFELLHIYIRDIYFREQHPDGLNLGQDLKLLPAHEYFDLLSLFYLER